MAWYDRYDYSLNEEVVKKVRYSGSWGSTESETRTMKITAGIDEDGRGAFEIYDVESGGEDYYGSGSLTLGRDGYLVDYDGVGSLDINIIEWLADYGFISPDEDDFFRREITRARNRRLGR
jgi:flagellar basal body rod protein FlgG